MRERYYQTGMVDVRVTMKCVHLAPILKVVFLTQWLPFVEYGG